jgi:1,4-alpha-glucan branching enzyme
MKKRFLKTKPVCKVTFELPQEAARGARKVALVGEFNSWDGESALMKRRKDGSFSITLDLPANREYQFKYLIDGDCWENDWQADKYLPSSIGDCENSVVVV